MNATVENSQSIAALLAAEAAALTPDEFVAPKGKVEHCRHSKDLGPVPEIVQRWVSLYERKKVAYDAFRADEVAWVKELDAKIKTENRELNDDEEAEVNRRQAALNVQFNDVSVTRALCKAEIARAYPDVPLDEKVVISEAWKASTVCDTDALMGMMFGSGGVVIQL
ncbi:MAG TPA: hypothetical protein VGE53_01620 [Candidatus Paceibacterota bacterium]